MAHLSLRGRTVVESTGPTWHLVGSVRRDKLNRSCLTLSRRRDPLSSRVKNAGKQILPAVRLTDLSGKSYFLTQVRITNTGPTHHHIPPHGTRHPNGSTTTSQQDTNNLEDFSFVFQKISIENLQGSPSSADDWT